MSIALMTMVWRIEFPTQSQLLIALKLADYANDEGANVYPSRSRIADLTQCSESTVKSVLRLFRDIGLLHVIEEGGKGPRSTTKYAFHVRLLQSLERGDCALIGGSDTLAIHWPDKGLEFDPLKGPEFDPLDKKRGQTGELRGQTAGSKGSEYLTPNLHLEPSSKIITGADARASDDARTSSAAKQKRLVLPEDADWHTWMDICRYHCGPAASQFEAEGGLVVFDEVPSLAADRPKLPPPKDSPGYAKLIAQRPTKGLSELSKRITGEVA